MRGALALIQSDPPGGQRVVTVRGEIDIGTTPALRDWLAKASGRGKRSITVDLRGVPFLAIGGLYVLCEEARRMAAHRARLTLVCTDDRILQLLAVCRLEDVLCVVPERTHGGAVAAWSPEDDERAVRLRDWLRRHDAASA